MIELSRFRFGRTWKLRDVRLYAGNRPCAWIDDDLGSDAFAWADERAAPTLLLRADPGVGMTEQHERQLESFGRAVADDE